MLPPPEGPHDLITTLVRLLRTHGCVDKICKKCGPQDLSKYYHYVKNGYDCYACLKCAKDRREARHRENPGQRLLWSRGYRINNREKSREADRTYQRENREIYQASQRRRNREAKMLCLRHYGGDDPACKCCGEQLPEFLCLDHKDGGGNKHRAEIKQAGSGLYHWVKKNNFPPIFRVLCHNCNFSLGLYGYCPHEQLG